MPKKWMILSCMLFLGSAGTSQAMPLDSPDIVYIDGLPCNSLCQSYMAWSRNASSAQRSAKAVARRVTGIRRERSKPPARVAKQAAPNSSEMPQAKLTNLQPAGNAAAASDAARANVADSHPANGAAAGSNTRTIQQQVTAAAAVAEQVTAATAVPAPERSDHSETVQHGDAEKAIAASPNGIDIRIALLMARPEIKSVSDLAGKNIAIDGRQSASNGSVRTAIAAAGAAEAQLSDSQTKAIDRLISGEVPAAVLTLVSPEAAEWFPEIAGFRIFRIPLSPRSLEARLQPAGNTAAAAGSNTRTIQEQVTAATAVAERMTVATVVPAPERQANDADHSDRSETVLRGDAEKTAPASPNDTDLLVALVMARPEIKSVSDLTNKNIAIDDRQSASNGSVRTAIVAAGAAEVQLSEGQTKAVNRLISGEVPAAVLTLVSPEAAEGFPEIAGFKIFRIPLSPRSLKARL